MNSNFKNKNILVTGASGFVGHHLFNALEKEGANVWGFSRNTSDKKIIKMNVINFRQLDAFIKDKKINILFHLAGTSLVEEGQKDPYNTFNINFNGTLNVLESARLNKINKIIIASTAHVYGNSIPPFRESDFARPSRPYETSKACSDLLAQSYADTFNLPVFIGRFVNIYGPGDNNYSRLIPKTIKAVLRGEDVEMWGGNALREYLYINDAINAYLKMAVTEIPLDDKNRIFNFGGSQKATVSEIIESIIVLTGKGIKVKKISELRESELKSQFVMSTKAKKILSWSPRVNLHLGLKETIKWYKSQYVK